MAQLLQIAEKRLAWPSEAEIFQPPGAGPRVLAELADRKIGGELRRLAENDRIRAGVIVAEPAAEATGSALAVVCDFPDPPTADQLNEAHRLAWNFSRAPLLLAVDPYHIRVWSCYDLPARHDVQHSSAEPGQARSAELERFSADDFSTSAAATLHWVNLITGSFADRYPHRFQPESRADRTLLANLRFVRSALHERGLDYDVVHDLLARIIFIQFLFDRKDSSGKAALDADRLRALWRQGVLSAAYSGLGDLLGNYSDTYSLFQHLDERFNGDLFPRSQTGEGKASAWDAEMAHVQQHHIELLADFVSGRLDLGRGQYSLWRMYSFDAIPLEFISSIYEEFVAKRPGTVYTPAFLVDFLLDMALPWGGTAWDLKVLDPACGSGIFLVKAFQRLIYRWKNANPGLRLEPRQLRRMLERNIFGVDSDEHAIRVASFSLYLAMCDEIDPRHYWHKVTFPPLRGRRLINADFFEEDRQGFRTAEDASRFDVIVGNVPWARGSIKESPAAQRWQKEFNWTTFDRNIGPLFLPKAAALTKAAGRVALLQPATLLFSDWATDFRRRFFSTFRVEEVVNLAAMRHELFDRSVGPACAVFFQPGMPAAERILYISPKPTLTEGLLHRITIEPHDVEYIHRSEATSEPDIWPTLTWGGRRDVSLLRRLAAGSTLLKLRRVGRVATRNGIMRGKSQRKPLPELDGRLFLGSGDIPMADAVHLDVDQLNRLTDPYVHRKDHTSLAAFETPQLIVGRSWKAKLGRFQAALVGDDTDGEGVVCEQGFVSVHASKADRDHLQAACLAYNSIFGVYYLFLTSGRFASYRPNLTVGDLLSLPYPPPEPGLLRGIAGLQDVDDRVRNAFGFDEVDWILIQDLYHYRVPELHGRRRSPGQERTRERNAEGDPVLVAYCEFFIKVLEAGLRDSAVSATVFLSDRELSVRLVAIHLDWPGTGGVRLVRMSSEALFEHLATLNGQLLSLHEGAVRFQRVARIYSTVDYEDRRIPTVFIIKPDQVRYWTRSTALRDADEVVADALPWSRGALGEVTRATS